MSKPFIGITTGYDYEKDMLFLKNGYYEGVLAAGGVPVAIPPVQNTNDLDLIISKCDGLLLCGGPDVDAVFFGEDNMQYNGEISPCRDMVELYFAKKAFELKMPIFGICRGIQVMNIAMGGTIYQDINSQIKGRDLVKHSQNAPKWYPTHEITIEENTHVLQAFGDNHGRVNSFHHQSVKDVAPGFVVTSRSKDGVIESIEHPTAKFAVGVQWHPELMWQKDAKHLNLFREFVKESASK
jgi:putative glutamine amidotransferase